MRTGQYLVLGLGLWLGWGAGGGYGKGDRDTTPSKKVKNILNVSFVNQTVPKVHLYLFILDLSSSWKAALLNSCRLDG